MLDDDIDYESEWQNFLGDVADEIMIDEVFERSFSLADKTLKSLLLDKTEWLNEVLIENFQTKYSNLSVSKLDAVGTVINSVSTPNLS